MKVMIHLPDGRTLIHGTGLSPVDDVLPAADDAPPKTQTSCVMDVEELAGLLKLNAKTVYSAIKNGQIPGVLRVGRTVRLSRDKVERWLAGEERVPSSRRSPR